MNKQLLSILSLFFSLVLALAIYLYFDQIEDKNLRPISIVPDNYAFILESNASRDHFKKLNSVNFIAKFMSNEKTAQLMQELYFYDSLIKSNETVLSWFSQGQAVYSFHKLPNQEMSFFMAVQTLREVNEAEILGFFQSFFPDRYKFVKRKFMQENIYDFTDFKNQTGFSVAFKSKLMLFSADGNMVENVLVKINKVNNEILNEDKLSFIKNSGDGFNLHVNYANFAGLLNTTLGSDSADKYAILESFAQRAVYNISLEDEQILLKGAAQTHDANFEFLDLLHAQAPIENNLRKLLPEKIHFSYTLGFNGYRSFAKNVKEFLTNKNLQQTYQSYADSLEAKINMPFVRRLGDNIGNHASLFVLDEPGISKDSNYVVAIESVDEANFAALMKQLDTRWEFVDSLNNEKDTVDHAFIKVPFANLFKYYFTDLLSPFPVNYCVQKGKYFFFTNNTQTLKRLQYYWDNEQFLYKNENYQAFEKKLSPNSNLEIYINPAHAAKYALHFVNNNWFSQINQNMGLIKKVSHVGIQFAGSSDKIFATQICAQTNSHKTEKTEQIWAIQLDSALLNTPQVVMNYSMGIQVILAQDKSKKLYAIDREGMLLWEKNLDGEIISSIQEIDLFGNGKRQWVFNTAHQIYVIHDNGENCQGWPAWIPTGTKFPISLFDPNSDRNYQFFCSGLYYKITAFNSQGRPLPYWNPKEVWPSIKSPIGNFYFKGSQVYWYLNEAGKLQFMNREAKPNIDIILDSAYKFNQVNITAVDTNEFIIRGLDSNELVKIKYTSGKKPVINKLAAVGFNSFSLVKNDQYKYDYLFQNELQIVMQNEAGEVLLKKAWTEPILDHAQYTLLGEGKKIIYVNKTNSTLHVEQINGNGYPPFPMQINGRYAIGDLFNDADYWLIFSDYQNKLNLYKVK